jgi:tRNA(fMet)-specific endonuclease VapC
MTTYLLDTTPLAAYLFGRRKAVERIHPLITAADALTSIVVYGEIEEFIKPMPNYHDLHNDLRRQLREIRPLPVTYAIMDLYADIRLQMRVPRGAGVISDSDTLIAATALRYGLTIITANSKDFRRVPDLSYEELVTKA